MKLPFTDEEREAIIAKMYAASDAVNTAAEKYEDAARSNWAPEVLAMYFGPLRSAKAVQP